MPCSAVPANGTVRFSEFDTAPDELVGAVDSGLDEFNHSVAPLSDVLPLSVFALDGNGKAVGGAIGRTWGSCCELLQLWVAPESRGKGVGTELLHRFELRARLRDCRVFYLTTLSYQAPEFYRRHGYETLAEISGYPNGIRKYLMQRTEA